MEAAQNVEREMANEPAFKTGAGDAQQGKPPANNPNMTANERKAYEAGHDWAKRTAEKKS